MDDLISRISLKQSIAVSAILKDKKTLEQIIDEEPSADNDSLYKMLNEAHNEGYDVGYWAGRRDYEQKWIRCSEKLPSEGENVLLSNAFSGSVAIGKLIRYNISCCWEVDHWDFDFEDWQAWMPLPKPYERKEE